jgi:uncharacterized protein YbaR (Trm112 family)
MRNNTKKRLIKYRKCEEYTKKTKYFKEKLNNKYLIKDKSDRIIGYIDENKEIYFLKNHLTLSNPTNYINNHSDFETMHSDNKSVVSLNEIIKISEEYNDNLLIYNTLYNDFYEISKKTIEQTVGLLDENSLIEILKKINNKIIVKELPTLSGLSYSGLIIDNKNNRQIIGVVQEKNGKTIYSKLSKKLQTEYHIINKIPVLIESSVINWDGSVLTNDNIDLMECDAKYNLIYDEKTQKCKLNIKKDEMYLVTDKSSEKDPLILGYF